MVRRVISCDFCKSCMVIYWFVIKLKIFFKEPVVCIDTTQILTATRLFVLSEKLVGLVRFYNNFIDCMLFLNLEYFA